MYGTHGTWWADAAYLQVQQSKLRGQFDQMHDNQIVVKAQNPLHVELLNSGELSRDVVIFKMSSHLGKLGSTAKRKYG